MYKLASLAVVAAACGAPSSSPIAQPTGPLPAVAPPVDPTTMQPAALPATPIPAAPSPPIATAPPLPTCIGAQDSLDAAVITTTGLSLCAKTEAGVQSCWLIDLASETWNAIPAIAPAAATATTVSAVSTTIDDHQVVHVCGAVATDCQSVAVAKFPDANAAADASSDRERLVAIWGQETFLRVFAVKTGQLITTIKSWNTPMGKPASVQAAHMVGGSLPGGHDVLEVMVGKTPVSSEARLFDPRTGALLGKIGKPDKYGPADIDERPPVIWADGEWAFSTFLGDRLYVHDARTAKLVKSIDVFDAADKKAAGSVTSYTNGLTARTADGKSIVVVPSAIGAWPVVAFNIATGARTALRAPHCN